MMDKSYHDYVIKNGQFVGRFEEMYSECKEIPWHQDETVSGIYTDLDLVVLRHMHGRHNFECIADIGCGLGYVTSRIQEETLGGAKDVITGFDIATSAVQRARQMFPDICFETLDVTRPIPSCLHGLFDLVICKECHWYVLSHLEQFRSNLLKMSKKWIYVVQSFPESKPYLGMDKFPSPEALIEFWSEVGFAAYRLIEWDSLYGGRPMVHLFLSKEGEAK